MSSENQRGRPFRPGQSGNPSGRPANVSGIRKAILRALGRKRDGKRTLDLIVERLTDKALSGNLVAAKLLIEYSYGKPATVADAVTWAADRAVTLRDVLMSPAFNPNALPVFSPGPERLPEDELRDLELRMSFDEERVRQLRSKLSPPPGDCGEPERS